jgi:hypothetical protein
MYPNFPYCFLYRLHPAVSVVGHIMVMMAYRVSGKVEAKLSFGAVV